VRHPGRRLAAAAIAAAAAVIGSATTASAQGDSVVKITCRLPGGKVATGTGFAWRDPTVVVTALHVVAGCQSGVEVYSETRKRRVDGTPVKALREADLAVVELKESLNLVPLKEAPRSGDSGFRIWGYPQAVNTMQGDSIEFSLSLQQQPTLASLMTESEYKRMMGVNAEDAYPQYTTRILRVSSIIQPGHSGAPIFDKGGSVIGVGDGGLHKGVARINWAIPASEYLQALWTSKEAVPVRPSAQMVHFSATGDAEPEDIEAPGGRELSFSWSGTLGDMMATMSDDDVEQVQQMLADAKKLDLDLTDSVVNVYEDRATGAAIAVPQGVSTEFDAEHGRLTVQFAGERLAMFVQTSAERPHDSMTAFEEFLGELADWQPDPDSEDEREEDEDGNLALSTSRRAMDGSTQVGQMFTSATIEGSDFLGAALVVSDFDELTLDDMKSMLVSAICVELSAFIVD
jgi:hypothetical protein